MDYVTFVAQLIDSLAWPTVVVIAVIILRNPLAKLIPLLRELTYKDFQLKFGHKLEELGAQADEAEIPQAPIPQLPEPPESGRIRSVRAAVTPIAEVSARAAVSEAWRQVEYALSDYFEQLDQPRPPSYQGMRRVLRNEGHLVGSALTLYREMQLLRNKAVHSREFELGQAQALEFASLADRIIATLDAAAKEKNRK